MKGSVKVECNKHKWEWRPDAYMQEDLHIHMRTARNCEVYEELL